MADEQSWGQTGGRGNPNPALAAGGIVDSPRQVIVGEGGVPEAVIPLPPNFQDIFDLPELVPGIADDAEAAAMRSTPVISDRDGGLTVNIEGNVMDGEDFNEKVNEARFDNARRGG